MTKDKYSYINREVSWLQFNARVLQEAEDESVPLIERLRFLGIFSNNLDEFFKVRYATIKRIDEAGKTGRSELGGIKASDLLEIITQIVIKQQRESLKILDKIQKRLEKKDIYFINEHEIDNEQHVFIKNYYIQNVSPALVTIILNDQVKLPTLKDSAAYLAVKMVFSNKQKQFALIEIPKTIERFVVLPKKEGKDYIIILDDLLRYCLNDIFNIFDYETISAHMIKITRDGELDFESDLSKSFIEKISDSVKHRQIGDPVRFVYDKTIDRETLKFLMTKMGIDSNDNVIPGGRYHNRRDYMSFPSLGRTDLLYDKIKPLPIKGMSLESSIFKTIANKDYLLYTPYQTFSYVVKFLREAALDPKVKTIQITIYRLAEISHVASSLINAAKNGKKVIVQIELQARFDESANIKYAKEMQSQGIKLMFGSPHLKVHGKICIIERKEEKLIKNYGFISTGNLNESTAKVYTDMTLFTSNTKILGEVKSVFNFFDANYKKYSFKNLIISPINTESKLKKLINKEIKNAKLGKSSWIKIKINNITSRKMIKHLYNASRAGVKIKMIVRGVCCLIPNQLNMSENIEVISIIDKYLEHTRFFVFCNNNDNKVFISSADWMTRNLDNRVEVTCPIFDDRIKQQIRDVFNIYWKDNIKSRYVNNSKTNKYKRNSKTKFRSQEEVYKYYLN